MDELIEKKTFKQIGEENKQRILDLYVGYVEEHGKNPPVVWLSEQAQLTRTIVYKHLRALKLEDIGVKFKSKAIMILEGMAKKAIAGDVQAAKLILNLAFGYSEKKHIEVNQTSKSIQVVFTTTDKNDINKITDTMKQTEDVEYEEVEDEN